MSIWVSRYSNKELANGNYYCVGISLGKPKFGLKYILRKQCYDLAPDRAMWGKGFEDFKTLYFEKLDNMGVQKVKSILNALSKSAQDTSQDLVLLCFEDVRDPEDWCHRTMLAEWVKTRLGLDIKELPNPEPLKKKKSQTKPEQENNCRQLSIFDICNA